MSSINGVDYGALEQLGLTRQRTAAEGPSNELGPDDFMTLMLAQLRNQDPMSPMENEQFLAQLAQFNATTGIQEMNESFQQFVNSQQSNQALQASTLVGRSALVPSDISTLNEGGSVTGVVDLPSSTQELRVGVYDTSGQLVRTMNLGAQAAGRVDFTWDGLADDGSQMPPGTYAFSAGARSGEGVEAVNTLIAARVESVTLGRNGYGTTLNLEGVGSVELSDIREVM